MIRHTSSGMLGLHELRDPHRQLSGVDTGDLSLLLFLTGRHFAGLELAPGTLVTRQDIHIRRRRR